MVESDALLTLTYDCSFQVLKKLVDLRKTVKITIDTLFETSSNIPIVEPDRP